MLVEPDCAFCDIVNGLSSASLVFENVAGLAFMNRRQVHPGHVLVIPKLHLLQVYDLSTDLAAQLFKVVLSVSRGIRARFNPDGLSIFQANGAAANQEINHFHIHILPRTSSDALLAVYPDVLPPIQARDILDHLAEEIRLSMNS